MKNKLAATLLTAMCGIALLQTLTVAAVMAGILAAPVHADPPNPVQCKPASASTVCRYADGSVQICYAMFGCHPVNEQLAPGFWDQP